MAAHFQYPIQCIQYLEGPQPSAQSVFIASAGPRIYSWSADDGCRISVWPLDSEIYNIGESPSVAEETHSNSGADEPPEKKRKLSLSEQASRDIERRKPGKSCAAWSSIPILVASPTQRCVVAVTGEDKCLRVFSVSEDGGLIQISERYMPKRPCTIALTTDGDIILSGDKFGDVYALPLILSDDHARPKKGSTSVKPVLPSASPLTVHTKKNLVALRQQLLQSSKCPQEKDPLTFECQLLLGHVSMLTDLAFVSLARDSSMSGVRSYILTADRDEHIRVSRGPPQTHVIESYCLGHTEFISKICIPPSQPTILISGGGDEFLLIWDWRNGQILQKIALSTQDLLKEKIAVRGIWAIPLSKSPGASEGKRSVILVALEGSPWLACYILEVNGEMRAQLPTQLSGNVLNVTAVGDSGTIAVSVDGLHEDGCTKTWRDGLPSRQTFLQLFDAREQQNTVILEPLSNSAIDNINRGGTADCFESTGEDSSIQLRKSISESLYNIGNLRKRVDEEQKM